MRTIKIQIVGRPGREEDYRKVAKDFEATFITQEKPIKVTFKNMENSIVQFVTISGFSSHELIFYFGCYMTIHYTEL